ncbi:DNA replication complex GINS protein SLD5-like [Halichondria panicea]|uniref:DNA replication complex GINS protein SLD5-like n=1 Tax=Halichondria panicea TaxID=6063 RepID=UPI00312BA9DA
MAEYSEGSSDDEYETMTTGQLLAKLEEAWVNEKFSPELLYHKTEIIDCIEEQFEQAESSIGRAPKGDFVSSIHKFEIERIKFVLCSYLRTRLQKIEKHVVHILECEAALGSGSESRLSGEELEYAKEFVDNMDTHLNSLVLQHMPANFQKMDRKKAVVRPNLDSYVFVKAVEPVNGVAVDPEEDGADRDSVDLSPGNQYILRYRPVSSLVHSGAVKLI